MKTTKEQRDKLRALLEKTSKGNWEIGKCVDGIYADKMCIVNNEKTEIMGVRQTHRRNQCTEVEENAKFIAEVHNILADLLDDFDEIEEDKNLLSNIMDSDNLYEIS